MLITAVETRILTGSFDVYMINECREMRFQYLIAPSEHQFARLNIDSGFIVSLALTSEK